MIKKRFRISIVLLIGSILLTGFLRFMPISISFGQTENERRTQEEGFLRPGRIYLVRVRAPMKLPDGIDPVPAGYIGQGFIHDGKRQDNPKKHCGGDITRLLQDDGRIKYRCEKCKKTWDQMSDGSKEGL